jgi:hypothetical protein
LRFERSVIRSGKWQRTSNRIDSRPTGTGGRETAGILRPPAPRGQGRTRVVRGPVSGFTRVT